MARPHLIGGTPLLGFMTAFKAASRRCPCCGRVLEAARPAPAPSAPTVEVGDLELLGAVR